MAAQQISTDEKVLRISFPVNQQNGCVYTRDKSK